MGWLFETHSELTISALGVFDGLLLDGPGLVDSHAVGLWTEAGSLLASVLVPSGTAGTLIGNFRYAPIAPIVLVAGERFVIGAHFPTTADLIDTSGVFTSVPQVTVLDGRSNLGGGFLFPSVIQNTVERFGPNLLVVPEPTTGLLLGLGLVGLAARARRRG